MRVLLPRATVVTPNMAEAAVLAGVDGVSDVSTMEQAARRIAERSHGAVVIKGGHLENSATDIVLHEGHVTRVEGERLAASRHGTGCAFSSSLAASLAQGKDLVSAARAAKAYVTTLLRHG